MGRKRLEKDIYRRIRAFKTSGTCQGIEKASGMLKAGVMLRKRLRRISPLGDLQALQEVKTKTAIYTSWVSV